MHCRHKIDIDYFNISEVYLMLLCFDKHSLFENKLIISGIMYVLLFKTKISED